MNAVERAVQIAGGQAALARTLDVTPQAVHQWARGVRQVPIERAQQIERATGGLVPARELRPDLAEIFAAAPAVEQGAA
jgi:DNA-binding transcriptional regulator YdaS (Cro superfamily)